MVVKCLLTAFYMFKHNYIQMINFVVFFQSKIYILFNIAWNLITNSFIGMQVVLKLSSEWIPVDILKCSLH